MTDRINLAELRAAITRSRDDPFGYPWYETGAPDSGTTLALLDAVEAAQEFAVEGFDNGVPGDPFDKLHQALDRFEMEVNE